MNGFSDSILVLLVSAIVLLTFLLVSTSIMAVILWRVAQRKTPISTGFEAEVIDAIRRLDERVKPLPKPTIDPADAEETIEKVIEEGRCVGEQTAAHNRVNGHKITGAEKQRAAMEHIRKRLDALNLSIDYALVAVRLESAVRKNKEQTK